MGKLIYSAITSLDGYVADREDQFGWAEPSEEAHAFINELERPLGTYLYGRRMYEVMLAWEAADPGWPPVMQDFAALWKASGRSSSRKPSNRYRPPGRGSSGPSTLRQSDR